MRIFKLVFSLNFLYITLIAAETAAIIFLCLYIPAVLPVTVVFTGAWLFTVAVLIIILSRRGSPEVKGVLALLVTALPVAGAVIYLIASARHKKYAKLKVEGMQPLSGIEQAAYAACGVGGACCDGCEYLPDGGQFFNRLFSEIEKAKESVYLEYFIVGRGQVFSRLISALTAANRNGAKIRLIADGIGSAFKAGKKEFKKLKALGAEVKIFHRLAPLPYSRLNFRDHRKIAVIDGKTAFIGGINIADEYANINSPYGYWKDVGAAVHGSAAKIFEGMFLAQWNGAHTVTPAGEGRLRILPFCDNPHGAPSFAENAFLYVLSRADERVHIMTPYFCPSEKMRSSLAFAAQRGVDVCIILPHVPDKKYAFELSKACAEELMPYGVKFYEYTPGFMHAKLMVCDGSVYIGSYNFDFRSMHLNCECGAAFGEDMTRVAELDFRECLRMSAPLKSVKLSPFRRAVRFFLKLIAPLV